ncbi:MAG: CDP-diacylglycerol--serine O-phosphatidyltransferase [Acidobacteria bacterium SCN 69-37]|nr:MAG: CDP-diacylglycerol--serine O-phosphatidyltransferase [Acidobacteria bacterium SCN 69-37]
MIDNGTPRRTTGDVRHYRRGIFLLPSIITVGNMFCGYACVVFAMRNELTTAAPFIGFAVVLDMLDGRIARLTNTTSAFGLEFDSLADVISFGLAPAILAFAWGLSELGRVGWAAGFVFVTAAAMRLARFNIQTQAPLADKRYFIGMPSPAAAGVTAATVYAWPYPLVGPQAVAAVALVLIPAILMVSTIRFRSFKSINFGWTPSYINILLVAGLIALIATEPRITLVVISYGYLLSAFIEMALTRNRPSEPVAPPPPAA